MITTFQHYKEAVLNENHKDRLSLNVGDRVELPSGEQATVRGISPSGVLCSWRKEAKVVERIYSAEDLKLCSKDSEHTKAPENLADRTWKRLSNSIASVSRNEPMFFPSAEHQYSKGPVINALGGEVRMDSSIAKGSQL